MIQGQKDRHKKYYKTWTFENGHANYPVDSFAKTENLMHIYGNGYIDKHLGTRIYKLVDDVNILDMANYSSGFFSAFEGLYSGSTSPVIFCNANGYFKKKRLFQNENFANIPNGLTGECPTKLTPGNNGSYTNGTFQMNIIETTISFTQDELNNPSPSQAGTYRCVLFFTQGLTAKPKIYILETVYYKKADSSQVDLAGKLWELTNTGLYAWRGVKYRTTTIFFPYMSNSMGLSAAEDCAVFYFNLPVGQQDETLIGGIQYKETLYIFKENSIWSLYTESFPSASSTDYKIRCEVKKLNRILPYTITYSEEGIYFATLDGIYLFDGTLYRISEKGDYNLLQDVIAEIIQYDSYLYAGSYDKYKVGQYCYGAYDYNNKIYLFGYPTNNNHTTWKNITYQKGKFYPLSFEINPSGMYYCPIDNFIWCHGSKATPIYKPYKINYGYGFNGLEGTSDDTKISSSLLTPIADCDNPHILKKLINIYINGYIPPANYADCILTMTIYNREMTGTSYSVALNNVYINSEGITVPIVVRNFTVQNFYYISCLLTMKQKVYIKSITVEYEKVGILS